MYKKRSKLVEMVDGRIVENVSGWLVRRVRHAFNLLVTVVKWSGLAVVVGVLSGAATALFLNILGWGITAVQDVPNYYYMLPAVFVLNALLAHHFSPRSEAHTATKMIEYIHKSRPVDFISILKSFFLPVLTIGGGGSAGKETPAADVSAGIGSVISDVFHLEPSDRKKLMICGLSAGFSAVFGTPIAGAIFGVEVLFAGSMLYEALMPALIAGITSAYIASALGTTYFYQEIQSIPQFNGLFLGELVLAGIFFGVCAAIFIEMMKIGQRINDHFRVWAPFKAVFGGLVLLCLTLVFSPKYLGLGLEGIESALDGQPAMWYDFLLKGIFTSVTLNGGGSGGTVTPMFYIGSTAGSFFAQALNSDLATFSALGLVALLSGVANTPIAASLIAMELFGVGLGPYATIVCIISFVVSGNRSVYSSQILTAKTIRTQPPEGERELL